jgi:hypothetical protein
MQTRDDITKMRRALECACDNNTYLSTIATVTLRANWTTLIGNSINYTYDGSNNVITAEYYTGATLVFTQTFTYDGSNNCINITTT